MDTDNTTTVYFVRNGEMHSSWILGHLDIDAKVDPSNEHTSPQEIAAYVVSGGDRDCYKTLQHDSFLTALIARPGRWLFVSGHNVVHSDDCYATREQAANAYTSYLLGDNEEE